MRLQLPMWSGVRVVLWGGALLAGCNGPDGDTKPDDSSEERENAAPVLTLDRPSDGEVYQAGDDIPLSGFVADDNDPADALILRLESSINGVLPAPEPSAEGIFSTVIRLAEGTHTLSLSATDGEGATGSIEVSVRVDPPGAQNNAPTTPIVHIDPALPQTGEALTVVVDVASADPDGDPLSIHTRWSRDGQPEGDDVLTISGDRVEQNQHWRVEYWTEDGQVQSAHAVAEVTVGNGSPAIDTVIVQPDPATVLTDLTCVASATDPEGEAISYSYTWWVDGADAGQTAQILPAGIATWGVPVYCEVTASDGQGSSRQASPAITIGNEPPQPPALAFAPAEPVDTDDITCGILTPATDPDAGQLITYGYAWYRDGQPTGLTGADLSADLTHRDEVWRCEVTATDSAGGSAAVVGIEAVIGRTWQDQVGASTAAITIDGLVADGQFGKTLAIVGDTDGDGLSELFVGASGENGGAGALYLFSGSDLVGHIDTGNARSSWNSSWGGGALGGYRAMAAPGDLDGDGLSELLVGAADADANGQESGVVLLMYGGGVPGQDQDINTVVDWRLLGDLNDNLGVRASAGDINGDGLPDLLVSAAGSSDFGRLAGVAAVFLNSGSRWSGTGYLSDGDRFIYGDDELQELGWTTRVVGDVNGDGYADWVTTSIYEQDSIGVMGLFFGARSTGSTGTLSAQSDALFVGDDPGDRLGYDAVGDFDADGDGISELALGAYLDDAAGVDAGALHVYSGRAAWAGSLRGADADWIIEGGAAGDRFGHVLGSPGDIDSDGTGDLLIGALLTEPTGQADQGSVWALLGPDLGAFSSATDIPWQSWGEAAGDIYGDALTFGQGDVQGDGKPDFGVGAQLHDAGGSNAGRVYLWSGR